MKTVVSDIGLCLLWILISACSPPSESTGIAEPGPIPVRVMEVHPVQLPLTTDVVGRLAPNREVTLAAEVGGVIAGYNADIGDRVEKGSVLISLDPSDYRLALKEAEANLTVARTRLDLALKAYNRSKSLLPRKVITQDAYENAEAEYLSAGASLERMMVLVDIAKAQLVKTRIRSPFNGHTAARMIETGQLIGVGQPLMKIIESDPIRVKVWLPEKEYVRLDRKDPVSIVIEAFPETAIAGTHRTHRYYGGRKNQHLWRGNYTGQFEPGAESRHDRQGAYYHGLLYPTPSSYPRARCSTDPTGMKSLLPGRTIAQFCSKSCWAFPQVTRSRSQKAFQRATS